MPQYSDRSRAKFVAAERKTKQRSLEDVGLSQGEVKEVLSRLPSEQEYLAREEELLRQAEEIRERRAAIQIPLAELRQGV